MLLTALLVSVVSGQVAGVCGPGKQCEVRSLRATGSRQAGSTQAGLVVDNGVICFDKTCTLRVFNGLGALATYHGVTRYFLVNPGVQTSTSQRFVAQGLNSGLVDSPGGQSFASFPTCNATYLGELRFDSTNTVWRWCDGSEWKAVASEVDVPKPAQFAGVCFGVCSEDTYFTGAYQPASQEKVSKVTCSWRVPGTGGSTGVVVRVVDVDTPDVVCECTLGACNTAANQPLSCSCSGNLVDKRFTFRLSSSTDCAVNPTDIVCNAG
jgi:hypothetical protein